LLLLLLLLLLQPACAAFELPVVAFGWALLDVGGAVEDDDVLR